MSLSGNFDKWHEILLTACQRKGILLTSKVMLMSKSMHAVFNKYTVDFIASQTGYSEDLVRKVRRGTLPASRKFRRLVSLALGEPEEALFAPPGARGSQPEEAGDGAAC